MGWRRRWPRYGENDGSRHRKDRLPSACGERDDAHPSDQSGPAVRGWCQAPYALSSPWNGCSTDSAFSKRMRNSEQVSMHEADSACTALSPALDSEMTHADSQGSPGAARPIFGSNRNQKSRTTSSDRPITLRSTDDSMGWLFVYTRIANFVCLLHSNPMQHQH